MWKKTLSESFSYTELRQKWDIQMEKEKQGSQGKILSLICRNWHNGQILTENWQNMEKLHCESHWAIQNQDKYETHRRDKKNKEVREKS